MQPTPPLPETLNGQSVRALSDESVCWSHAAYTSWIIGCSLLVVTRIAGITRQSLWYDEGYTLTLASSSTFHEFAHRFAGLTTSEHLQPLYYLLLFVWSRIAGVSDFALRAPSALASIGSGLLIYRIGTYLPHATRRFALAATLLYTVSSFSLFYAQEARPYALSQFIAFAVLASWIRNKQTLQARNRWFAFLCGVCTLCSLFTLLLLGSLALADLLAERSLRVWIHIWRLPMAVCTVAFSFYIVVSLQVFPHIIAKDVTSLKQPLWMNAWYMLYSLAFGTTLPPSSHLLRGAHKMQTALQFWPVILPASLVLLALIVGAYLLLRKASDLHPASKAIALTAVFYSLALFGGLGLTGHINLLPRHASVLFAILFVLGSLVALQLSRSRSIAGIVCFSGALVGLTLMNLLSIGFYRYNSDFRKDDYRAAAHALSSDSTNVYMPEGQPALLEHYGARVIDVTAVNPDKLAEVLRTRSHGAPQVHLILNESRGFLWDHSDGVTAELSTSYACIEDWHLSYMDSLTCTLKPLPRNDGESGTLLSQMGQAVHAR